MATRVSVNNDNFTMLGLCYMLAMFVMWGRGRQVDL